MQLTNLKTYRVKAERKCVYCFRPVEVGTVAARFIGGRAHLSCVEGVTPEHVAANRRIVTGQRNMKGRALLPSGEIVTYREYLDSAAWRARRGAFLANHSGRCEICRERPVSDVHHKTYKSLGRELDQHLAGLCRPCHSELSESVASAGHWRNWKMTETAIRSGAVRGIYTERGTTNG